MIPPCLILSIIRYRSRVNWSNPGKGVVPSLTPQCSIYWKGSLFVALDYGCQLYILLDGQYWYYLTHRLEYKIFVAASHQIGLDTRSKARRPIKVGIKGRGRSGTSRDSNPASHWPTKCNVGLMGQAVSRT